MGDMPSVSETAARIRAARTYADISQTAMARALGHSVSSQSRMEHGVVTPTPRQIEQIAQMCNVPMEFMQTGFALIAERGRRPTQADLLARVEQFPDRVTNLERLVRALARGLGQQRRDAESRAQINAALQDFESVLRILEADDSHQSQPAPDERRGTGR